MADIFSKLGDSIKTTIKQAVGQTQKSVDQASIRTDLLTKKSELKKLYQALGESHYKAYAMGETDETQGAIYEKITELVKDIAEAEKRLEDIVTTQKTSFSTFKEDVKTTWNEPTVGAQKNEEETQNDNVKVMKVCPVCNTGNNIHAAYCIHCGNKFE
ncbi:hypothetical protein [Cellulosilyticum ruminicola]|uniref:hypothetical protein n=1 Tax=Cellulosilyticum ruminicola TaxID=425254 RepID=UPI0006CFB728|nr:hypothetical protein [Cellulosilyticum ruminicola]